MSAIALSPYLTVQNATETIAFYEQTLGATEIGPRLTTPSGKVMHTELSLGDFRFMVADAPAGAGAKEGTNSLASSVRMCLEVDDVDAWIEKAVTAGATVAVPASDQFYGHRSGTIIDPGGQAWIFTKQIEDLSPEEIQQRAANLMGGGDGGSS